MKKRTIIAIIVLVAMALVAVGVSTDVFSVKVLPILKKAAKAVPPRMWVGLLFKLLVLTGLMGYVTKVVNARKERFLNGENEYDLDGDYSLIVGYDFQARPLIKRLLSCSATARVLLITDRDVRAIRAEMATELTKKEAVRLLYMRRDLALADTYSKLRISGAAAVYVLGDEGVSGRDGIVLRASEMIAEKMSSEEKRVTDVPVKAYLQLEDPGVYSQMCSRELSMDKTDAEGNAMFDLEVFNYYESWVWKCWSEKGSGDGGDPYLPLLFKPDAKRVELFVIGSGRAMKAVVDSAVTLMNYGEGMRHCRLSVVSDRIVDILPPEDVVAALPELEVVDYPMRELCRTVALRMNEAASNGDAATTIVIVEDAPGAATKTYLGLPFALRNKDVSVLLWMGSQSRNLPDKRLVKVEGDNTRLRYFGMSDCLPWFGSDRNAVGADINYYYSVHQNLPRGTDPTLVSTAISLWNGMLATDEWKKSKRWKKWSSINSSGSFKEKAAMIAGRPLTPELQLKLLKAEHNRWWVERLLGDWRVGERDNVRRFHPNLVPFEKLDDFTKDIDKICIAAMARQGFIG